MLAICCLQDAERNTIFRSNLHKGWTDTCAFESPLFHSSTMEYWT